jgi:hypothetical protein
MTIITGTLHEDRCIFVIISCFVIHRVGNVTDKSCRENQTHVACSVTVFRKLCHLWDNVEKYFTASRPQMTIRHMRIACCIPKGYKHTLKIRNNYCFSTVTMVAHVTLYAHCPSCLILSMFRRLSFSIVSLHSVFVINQYAILTSEVERVWYHGYHHKNVSKRYTRGIVW